MTKALAAPAKAIESRRASKPEDHPRRRLIGSRNFLKGGGAGRGLYTDSWLWSIKKRRSKKKAPKLPLTVCVSARIF